MSDFAQCAEDDRELLQRFAEGGEGSESAFSRLVERYNGLVYGTAMRRTGNREWAEDAAQNVFTALAAKAPDLVRGNIPSVGAWLHRAATFESKRVLRDQLKSQQRQAMIRDELSASAGDAAHAALWSEIRPELDEALEKLFSLRYELLSPLFQRWALHDPAAALEAWSRTPEAAGMRLAYPILEALHKKQGFAPTLAQVNNIDHPKLRSEALILIAQQVYSAADKQGVMELLLESASQEERAAVITSAVGSWRMRGAIEEVWDWVEARREHFDADAMAGLERAASRRLIESNPEEAIEWLMSRATDASRPGHLRHVANTWARSEPTAAAEWLGSLPPGPQNDQAVAGFVEVVVRDDPGSAALWAKSVLLPAGATPFRILGHV